jgi:hypothetical protein
VLYSISDRSITVSATNRASRTGYPVAEPKTDIFAIDPATGSKRLVFSDANASFFLVQAGSARGGVVAGGGRIFAFGVDRQTAANDHRAAGAIYELSTDGSGKARRIFDLDNFANLFVNPSGSKIGYMPGDSTETHVVLRDTATGKPLRDAEIFSRTIEAEGAARFGWTPDGKRIFFALSGGLDDEEALWTTPNSPIGTYVMNEDAGAPERLAPEVALHPKIPGMKPSPDAAADLIGVLPDGEYLLSDRQYSPTGNREGMYLYALDLAKKTQKIFPLHVGTDFHLSPSCSQLVMETSQGNTTNPPRYSPASTVDVWVVALESGKQLKLFSFTTPNVNNPDSQRMNLIGWLDSQ